MPPAELSSSEAELLRAFERQGHDPLATSYHAFFAAVTTLATDPLLDAVRLHPGTHLLSTLPVIFFTAASSISPYRSANAFLMALTTMSA